jgi:hypothetical protein
VLVVVAVLIGLALRLWEAFESSLWLDELHSLAHASPDTVAGVFEHTHWDFHVPLFFAAIHFLYRSLSPEALRIVPIVSSLLVLLPLLWFARRSRLGASAAPLAAGLFATLPFQIQFATELRPYAFLMLASATACWAAFSGGGSRALRFAVFSGAVAFGLWSHYLMAIAVILIGATRLVFLIPPVRNARLESDGPPLGLGWLVLAGAAGVAAWLPWVLGYMFWAVEDPGELVPPTEKPVTEANRLDLLEAPLKTLVPQLRSLGAPWTALAVAGSVLLAAGIAIAGIAWLVRAVKRDLPRPRRETAMALTYALLSVVLLGMSIWGWSRVSVRYVCISAWLWPLVICELLAAVRGPRVRAALAGLTLLGATLAAIAHAGGTTHEDVRGAVLAARSAGAELLRKDPGRAPYYTAFLSQPPRFEHCTPYLAYARDLPCVELKKQIHAGPQPPLLPMKGEPGFERPVVVVTRRKDDLGSRAVSGEVRGAPTEIQRLRLGRHVTRKIVIDDTMSVWVLEAGDG